MADVLLTTFSVDDENQNTSTKRWCCSIEVSHYVPGTGRVCTGVISSSETLRRISSCEGQNKKPLLVLSTSEFLHQYVEPVKVVNHIAWKNYVCMFRGVHSKLPHSQLTDQSLIYKQVAEPLSVTVNLVDTLFWPFWLLNIFCATINARSPTPYIHCTISTVLQLHTFAVYIRESVDSLCRDGADAQYIL